MDELIIKRCGTCKEEKPLTEFGTCVTRAGETVPRAQCAECLRRMKKNKKRTKRHKEYQDIPWSDPISKILHAKCTKARATANERNIAFTLAWQDLYLQYRKQEGKCAMTAKGFDFESFGPGSLSIVRVDKEKGFDPDNFILTRLEAANMKAPSLQIPT